MSLAEQVAKALAEIGQERRGVTDPYRRLDPTGLLWIEDRLLDAFLNYTKWPSFETKRIVRERLAAWDVMRRPQ